MPRELRLLGCASLLAALVACEARQEPLQAEAIRPVTVVTLQETSPARDSRRVGVAVPFREEQVGFEVGGRVLLAVDAGIDLEGPVLDEDDRIVREGDVIAIIDSARYVQSLQSIEAKISARRASLEAQRIEVEEVTQAELDLARVTYERQLRLVESGAASRELLDEAKSRYDVARATLKLGQAQLTAGEAEVADLEQGLEQARLNLRDCVLRAPFTGRVTRLHVARGAYVQPGQAVVTLTVFDPIKVAVAVSAVDDRRIGVGAMVHVRPTTLPPGAEVESCPARVQEKSQVADSSTRTFDVQLITRNRRYRSTGKEWVRQGRFMPAIQRFAGEGGPLYVGLRCLVQEGAQTFVYVLEGLNFWDEAANPVGGPLVARKVEVTLAKDYWAVLGWNLREVEGQPFAHGAILAIDPQRWGVEAGPLELERYDWLLRPGDIIEAAFQLGDLPAGYYVPVRAIRELNGQTTVLLAVDGRAQAVPVEAHETWLDTRRITGEGLRPGAELVVQGAHFVVPGERLSARPEAPR